MSTPSYGWRFCTRAAGAPNNAARTIPLVLATETPVKVNDSFRGMVDEVLVMSGGKFGPQLPLLDSHNRGELSALVGSIRELRIAGDELGGVAHFASTAEGVAAYELARDGHLTDVSIGFSADRVRWIDKGDTATIAGQTFKGPLRLIEQWTAKEGSLVAIGADANAKLMPQSMRAYPAFAARLAGVPQDMPPAFVIKLDGADIPIAAHFTAGEREQFLESLPRSFEATLRRQVGELMANAKNGRDVEAAGELYRSIPARVTALKRGCNAAREYFANGYIVPSQFELVS